MMSENKKMIEDEIKTRKEEEALFLYSEQMRKEEQEQQRLVNDVYVCIGYPAFLSSIRC